MLLVGVRALYVGIEDHQECGNDMPLIRGYIVEENGRIGRVEREQAYAPGRTATARPRALFLDIAPDSVVPASLSIVDIAMLGQHNTPLQGVRPCVMLTFEQTVGTLRDLRLHGMPNHLSDEHAWAEYPPRRHTTPYLRFYVLALNKGTGHGMQIEEWYTGFIFVSRRRIDLMDA
jgi:hypothetical protein